MSAKSQSTASIDVEWHTSLDSETPSVKQRRTKSSRHNESTPPRSILYTVYDTVEIIINNNFGLS